MLSAAFFGVALFLTWGWVDQGAPPWSERAAPPNPHLDEARAEHPEYERLSDAQLTRLLVERDPDRWAPLLGKTPAGVVAGAIPWAVLVLARRLVRWLR
jgi:hypothetical protein